MKKVCPGFATHARAKGQARQITIRPSFVTKPGFTHAQIPNTSAQLAKPRPSVITMPKAKSAHVLFRSKIAREAELISLTCLRNSRASVMAE
jgi:hypothetical protein